MTRTAGGSRYTVGSLFSGIGAMDSAFERAGFTTSFFVEIDPYCQAVLETLAPDHWPDARIFNDVKKVTADTLPACDVLIGGFPCQPVSVAGNRKAQSDERWLWPEFARLIGEIRPRCVLLENVPGILQPVKHTRTTYAFEGQARIYQRQLTYYTQAPVYEVYADLATLGYHAESQIISAANVGASHRRDRWWCVAYPDSLGRHEQSDITVSASNIQRHLPSPESVGRTIIHEIIASSQDDVADANGFRCGQGRDYRGGGYLSSDIGVATQNQSEGRNGHQSPFAQRPGSGGGHFESVLCRAVARIASGVDRYSWPARPGAAQYDWEAPRTITEDIPYRRARIKALGNSVVPQVVYPIAVAIREYLDGSVT